ncbi:ABC transporter permease [Cellulomonas palmilytica]|uniref:ABC transporter permease n=1 Tax=Cellulomonas palmilytica TaxID=2608402 RepID=UPI001F17B78C|nr:FtsX-like permease family protein [Cellulomonas palmilytica]UJP39572.1 FtsX-like permease family protein [Cellulomonas palmilytica]
MLRLTLAQMRRSLGRLTAAAIATAIGTGFVAATLLTGGVITRASYDSVTAELADADLVVDGDVGEIHDEIRATPGVVAADPLVASGAELQKGAQRSWQLLVPVPSDPHLGALRVEEGAAPAADDEIALPEGTAERLRVQVGDTVDVRYWQWDDDTEEGTENVVPATVTGLTSDPGGAWTQFGGASLVTLDALRTWGDLDEEYLWSDGMIVRAPKDTAAVQAALQALSDGVRVLTKDEASDERIREIADGDNVIVVIVLGFAAIALVVAALVISNTFQVLVAQRARMLALLRCVGAVRGQLRRAVLLEAGILGVASSVAGVVLGTVFAQVALSVLRRVQQQVPLPEFVQVTPSVVIVPVLVGTAVTLLAALVPARAATKVSPIVALRPIDAPDVGSRAGRLRLALALVLTVGGALAFPLAIVGAHTRSDDAVIWLGLGMLGGAISFVGILVGAVFWVPRVVDLMGRLLGRTGPAARLAAVNSVRNPRRTAATSTALLIGVTLVAMMSTGAASARLSAAAELDTHYLVDITVWPTDGQAVSSEIVEAVTGVKGVERATVVRSAEVTLEDDRWLTAWEVTPEASNVLRDDRVPDALRDGAIVLPFDNGEPSVEVDLAEVDPADPDAPTRTVTLDADVVESPRTGDAYVTPATFDELAGGAEVATTLWAMVGSDASAGEVVDAVRSALSSESVSVESPASERAQYEQVINVLLAIVVALLAVAVVIALIGVANTLSLSVIERRRESAILRAIGLTRRQLRLSLATEGALIAGVGGLFGALLGLLYGWAGAAIAFESLGDARLTVPWVDFAVIIAVALLAGLAASVIPARSAVRTRPVAALSVE